jgi:hypothetical protein
MSGFGGLRHEYPDAALAVGTDGTVVSLNDAEPDLPIPVLRGIYADRIAVALTRVAGRQ